LELIHESKAIPSQDLKTCKRCGETKPVTDFYHRGYRAKVRGGKTSPSNECKECTKERTRTRYYGPTHAEIKEQSNGHGKSKRSIIKAIVFAKYSGGNEHKCACCGETELQFLTLDHIDNDGARFRRKTFGRSTAAGYTTYSWLLKNGFPQNLNLQVLCANCQHGKRMNNGICPHQVRCNDYPLEGVGPSGPKRGGPTFWEQNPLVGQDIVSSVAKVTAASLFIKDLQLLLEKHKPLELERDLEAGLQLATQTED
jgi:hypothetical protein